MTDEVSKNGAASADFASASVPETASKADLGSDSGSNPRPKRPGHRRVLGIALLLTLLAAGIVLPPLVNIGRYQRQITALMSRSLGRPVHLSGVELRLLPTPGFVLHDLSVSEDPGFGAEPILSARTVVASVRLFSLWRGRLEVSRVSVDEASMNLVRTPQGRWNLESVLMGAAQNPASGSSESSATAPNARGLRFPYLEVTNSRVNLKNGLEKSPFSIVDTDLSLWQDEPGAWRVRLRGQPVRTDMDISSADTGEVRMEATVRAASQLRAMPLKLQVEWRDAQLGQLSRLLLGSDAGWRGDVTADIDVQGTPESALTKARLQATGVRRAEFAPDTPLDFDANCSFRYQHPQNAFHDLDCNTAIGDGRLHLKAELPGKSGPPDGMLEVSKVPIQAGLDLFRTVRSDFAPGIAAQGLMNGSLTYKASEVSPPEKNASSTRPKAGPHKAASSATDAVSGLNGSLTATGVVLKGGKLAEPLTLPSIVWTPMVIADDADSSEFADPSTRRVGLGARFPVALPVSATAPASPQAVLVRFGLDARGYRLGLGGTAGIARLRELAYAFGLPQTDAADGFIAGTADLNLAASGPWVLPPDLIVPVETTPLAPAPGLREQSRMGKAQRKAPAPALPAAGGANGDLLAGSIQFHHAQWKAPFLAGAVDLPQAAIFLTPASIRFDSDFSFPATKAATAGAAKEPAASVSGGMTLTAPLVCAGECTPHIELRFAALDAAALQAALLGVPAKKTLLSPLMDRMRSTERPKWPSVQVEVQAESLALGALILRKPTVYLRFRDKEVVLEQWQASLLGGEASGTGSFSWTPANSAQKPEYTLKADFAQVNASALAALLGTRWSGKPLSGTGGIHITGLSERDFAASAAGELSFDWAGGAIPVAGPLSESSARPAAPESFEHWTGKVTIRNGGAELGENSLLLGRRKASIEGGLTFGGPVRLKVHPAAQ